MIGVRLAGILKPISLSRACSQDEFSRSVSLRPGSVSTISSALRETAAVCGSKGGRKNETPGPIDKIVDQALFPRHESPFARQGLAQGTHLDIDLIFQTEIVGRASTVRPENAGCMGVVNHQGHFPLPGDL